MYQSIETRLENLRRARRCGAKSRAGTPRLCPAMRQRARCRLHGGRSTGAPRGPANGNYRTGDHTWQAKEERRWLRDLLCTFAKAGDVDE
jgi:hypothetical protein